MTGPANPPPGTAVAPAKREHPAVTAAKVMRDITKQLRGTIWGKDNPAIVDAVARYALRYKIDAVRHIDVLGGRIYLNGEFYEEKGAPLVLAGKVIVSEPDYVHHDQRLQTLAESGDAEEAGWARREIFRRLKARIEYGIPDDATAACVYRGKINHGHAHEGTTLVGFNWCGGATKVKKGKSGEYRFDPIGDAEPTKTAQSRAKRRMWRQIVVAIPEMEDRVGAIEAGARILNKEIGQLPAVEIQPHPKQLGNVTLDDYGAVSHAEAEPVVTSDGEAVQPLERRAELDSRNAAPPRDVPADVCELHDIPMHGGRCPACEQEELEMD